MLAEMVRLSAPAKINLHLRVGPVRSDGFHPLLTWMTTVGLFDTLEFSQHQSADQSADGKDFGSGDSVIMTCDDPSLPCDQQNLVIKAEKSLGGGRHRSPAASASGKGADAGEARSSHHLRTKIHLQKKIPSGAGLGGGSSDAATTLIGLNQLWQSGFDIQTLSRHAASLGSDVPFFLHGPSSICRGRGEMVRPIAKPAVAGWVVLMLPEIMMPTPAVYRKFDEMKLGSDLDPEPDWNQWCLLSSQELLRKLVNDLERPAFSLRPDLSELRAAIENTLARPVRMSGSGSSLFTLFDDQVPAAEAARTITNQYGTRAMAIEMTPAV
jgi:4-diphosphocytidyl-2C-methyl-D-erythritol kinase